MSQRRCQLLLRLEYCRTLIYPHPLLEDLLVLLSLPILVSSLGHGLRLWMIDRLRRMALWYWSKLEKFSATKSPSNLISLARKFLAHNDSDTSILWRLRDSFLQPSLSDSLTARPGTSRNCKQPAQHGGRRVLPPLSQTPWSSSRGTSNYSPFERDNTTSSTCSALPSFDHIS